MTRQAPATTADVSTASAGGPAAGGAGPDRAVRPDTAGPSRRAVLAGTGGLAALLALAACGSNRSVEVNLPAGTKLAATDEVPVGDGILVSIDDQKIVVAQPEEGTFTAFGAVCPHAGTLVQPDEDKFLCASHSAHFSATTGAVLDGPPKQGLTKVPVAVEGGSVVVRA